MKLVTTKFKSGGLHEKHVVGNLLIRFSSFVRLLVECYFIVGFWINYTFSGSWGKFKCDLKRIIALSTLK